jgi:hypothetical protein
MQNQAPYQNVLRLSIGLGSVFNILCIPAVAETAEDVALENAVNRLSAPLQPKPERSPSKLADSQQLADSRQREHPFAVEDSHRPQFSFAAPCQRCTALEWVNNATGDDDVWSGGAWSEGAWSEGAWSEGAWSEGAWSEEVLAPQPSSAAETLASEQAASPSKTETPALLTAEPRLSADLPATDLPAIDLPTTDLPATDLPATDLLATDLLATDLPKGLADSLVTAQPVPGSLPAEVAQVPDLSDILPSETDRTRSPDPELGVLRVQQLRSRQDEDLGILRLLQTAQAPPPPPRQPIAFLAGNLGFLSTDNSLRTVDRISDQLYQSGLTFYLFPRLSERTSLYAIADVNLARYENSESPLYNNLRDKTGNLIDVNYNKLELQLGIRQQLSPRTFAQIGWRNQRLYSGGFRERVSATNYLEALISHRAILDNRTWLDGFYQARLGWADPEESNRFRQTFTLSFNYGVTRALRTTLLYQLDLEDYTRINRYDVSQQVLGVISYELTPESRISLFGGTRFGQSNRERVDLDDIFYGAGLNINVPLF